ncbi:MAG: DUF3311 domain-containing protein [Acetobacteraceae bacterium]
MSLKSEICTLSHDTDAAVLPAYRRRVALRWLALLPFIGVLIGTPFLNSTDPSLFGLPLILVWLTLWVLLTSVIMTVIYLTDPANRSGIPEPRDATEAEAHR